MARIAGVTIPENKQVQYSLRYVYGIGPSRALQILTELAIDPTVRVKDLNDTEQTKIRDYINEHYTVEGELQRIVSTNVKRLKDIGSYRGARHAKNLPSRGQRTKTNARTRRGKKIAIGGAQPKAATKT